eukprot:SAG11_NODE_27870_length_327_cov_75.057018_1_plen_39_part_10
MGFAYSIRPRYFRRIIIILYRRTPIALRLIILAGAGTSL